MNELLAERERPSNYMEAMRKILLDTITHYESVCVCTLVCVCGPLIILYITSYSIYNPLIRMYGARNIHYHRSVSRVN